jgi:hypothetical protein
MFSKHTQISNFMKIRQVRAELFHVDGRTDRHDEANSHFFCNFTNTPKSDVCLRTPGYVLALLCVVLTCSSDDVLTCRIIRDYRRLFVTET